jgi:hypothetical protein
MNDPIINTLLMLCAAFLSLAFALMQATFWGYWMIVCACWWLFRCWGDLRTRKMAQ